MVSEPLKDELVSMAKRDLDVRASLVASGELFDGYHPEMEKVHLENAQRLSEIVDQHGWPGRMLVGDDGADAAWLIVQHAISSPAFQRKCLAVLREAVSAGEVPAVQVARLEDRIRVFEGRPQRYGTSFDWDGNGSMSPHPIEDADNVDARRATVGLGPLADAIVEMRQRAAAEGHRQPEDFDDYVQKRKAWAASVGWLDNE